MNASVKLGRPFGIPLGIHWSALLIAVLATWSLSGLLSVTAPNYSSGTYWTTAVLTIALYFAALVAHELAHAVVARRNGLRVEGITLWAMGGLAQLSDPSPTPGVELRVAAAGPAASVVASAVLFGVSLGIDAVSNARVLITALAWLAAVNLVIAVFNLFPARPLDGGRILTALIWWRTRDRGRAALAAARVSTVMGWAMAGVGAWLLLMGSFLGLWLLLVAWMIVGGATLERRVEGWRSALAGLRLRDVMAPPPPMLPGWTPVRDAVADRRTAGQHLVLVERFDGHPAGAASPRLLARLAVRQPGLTLGEAAAALPVAALRNGDESVGSLFDGGGLVLPILVREDDGRVVGQITVAQLDRWSRWRSDARPAAWRPPVPEREHLVV